MIKWRMRIASWIPKATNTHSERVIHIDFPLHKWLKERSSVLYVHCISSLSKICFSITFQSLVRSPEPSHDMPLNVFCAWGHQTQFIKLSRIYVIFHFHEIRRCIGAVITCWGCLTDPVSLHMRSRDISLPTPSFIPSLFLTSEKKPA